VPAGRRLEIPVDRLVAVRLDPLARRIKAGEAVHGIGLAGGGGALEERDRLVDIGRHAEADEMEIAEPGDREHVAGRTGVVVEGGGALVDARLLERPGQLEGEAGHVRVGLERLLAGVDRGASVDLGREVAEHDALPVEPRTGQPIAVVDGDLELDQVWLARREAHRPRRLGVDGAGQWPVAARHLHRHGRVFGIARLGRVRGRPVQRSDLSFGVG
jgi:hypothetical protein